jgi:cytosine permease
MSDHVVQDTQEDLLDDHALAAVPEAARRSLAQQVIVQIGWNISVSAFLVGGTIGAGTTLETALVAILLGNLFLSLVASLVGIIGFRTGLTSYLLSRAVFGTRGSVLVSLVLGILAMGFIGVLMDSWGSAINALFPAVPWSVVVLLFAVAITGTAIFGFKGLARFSALAVPVELAIALLALLRIGSAEGGFGALLDIQPATPIPFTVAMGAAIATWITGAALVSDVTRYARSSRDVVISSIVGFAVGAGVFETIATVSAMKVGNANLVQVMTGLGLLAPAVVMLVLALWNTADNNLYSSALAFTNASRMVGVRVPKPVWTVIAAVIAVAVAFAGFADRFLSWLQIIGLVTPPFAGVVITHFWVLGRLRRSGAELLDEAPAVRVEALAAWLAASLVTYVSTWFIDAIVGLVLGGVFYAALTALLAPLRRRAGTAAGTPAAVDGGGR